ncbi:tRNA (adenine(58)-N(1))-methyltransferase catalytic subunit TRMT61A isoform X2 [Chelonus insularis]|uniref:tRNA (adenine(58)-N(1))-methyltransferase catalytic subunit TRMT61A isoform X2 n=1 Tax=Chelonus insularis TaxID=460826 RepID=UPI00158A6652|nr:tRNA (adenine(58)-N(1))-methyltransferase catalytic subunit TRMT61A isoform X2 [Chelonus insularis]
MSFYQTKSTIEEKDVAVLYFGPQKMHSFEITPKIMNKKGELVENVFQTTHGALKIASLIGKKYGSRVELSRGWGYILQPTPELWTETLPHRTQIIYTADCSLIVHLLNLIPGSVVVETVADRDVCREGFGDNLKLKADAILLDLPLPWLTIDHAVNTLKTSGGKLCSFSPCIEQVQQTCLKLEATGFVDINVYELLQKELTVVFKSIPKLDLECLKKQHTSDEVIKKKTTDEDRILTVNHSSTLPGHTGYLTVATLPPLFARIIPKNT